MSKISLRYKILIIIALIAVTLLGLGYFIILPSRSAIIRAKNIIENRRQSLEQKYTRGQDISLLAKNIEKISLEAKNLNKIFIVRGQELQFITALEAVAEQNNINQTIHMSPPQAKADEPTAAYQTTDLQLAVAGKFSHLMKYLNDLEKLDYLINITAVDISKKTQPNLLRANDALTSSDVSATIHAVIYFINKDQLL